MRPFGEVGKGKAKTSEKDNHYSKLTFSNQEKSRIEKHLYEGTMEGYSDMSLDCDHGVSPSALGAEPGGQFAVCSLF